MLLKEQNETFQQAVKHSRHRKNKFLGIWFYKTSENQLFNMAKLGILKCQYIGCGSQNAHFIFLSPLPRSHHTFNTSYD